MATHLLNFEKSGRSIPASSSPYSRGFADMSLFVARRFGLVAAVAFAVGACSPQSSAAPPVEANAPPAASVAQVEAPASTQPVGTLNGRALPDFTTLVEQVGPAVVNVSVVEKAHRVAQPVFASGGDDAEDPFQEFFRRFGIPDQGQGGDAAASKFRSARVKARASS